MKNTSWWMAAVLGAALCATSCNKSGKLNKESEFKIPSGPIELKLKWPLGQRVEQDVDVKMTVETAVPGQPAPIKQDMTIGEAYSLTVLQANADGTHEIEMEFLSARMAVVMGGKAAVDYDSTKKAEPDKVDPVGNIFNNIVGAKVRYFLDASNNVDHMEGVTELAGKVATGASAPEFAALKSVFNEEYFKQLMRANQLLPTNAVQPGDTWSVKSEIPMGMMGTMVMSQDFSFERWEMHGKRNCALLSYQGAIQGRPSSEPQPGGMSMNIQDGTCSGMSWFDPELGITIDTTMNQSMKMVMQVPAGQNPQTGKPQMQTVSSAMNQALNVKLVSVK